MAEGDRRVAFRRLPGMRRRLLGEGYGKRADYLVDGQALSGVRIAAGHLAAIVCGGDGRLFHGALGQGCRMGRSDRFRCMLHGTIAAIARCSSKGFNVSHRAALLCAAMVAIETGMGLTALAEAGAAHDLASVLLTVSSALRGVGVAVFQVLYVCELAQASSRERHFDALLPLALVVSAVATLGMWARRFSSGHGRRLSP